VQIVRRSMEHPVTVTMVTLAAVLFGFVSLSRLDWNLLPDISYPTLTLRTEYADAAPAEVENLITEPLEESISVVRGLRNLRSVSRAGASEITLEFAWNTDMDYAALDVREKIDLVDLPEDTKEPVLLRYDPNLDPILRIGLYGELDPVSLRHLADRVVKKDLESLDGVASARVRGGLEEEIQISIDEGKLAKLGIGIGEISQILASQNVNASGGSLRDRDAEFLLRTVNQFVDIDEIGRTVLREDQGRRVTLADVATVERGFKEREVISRVQGRDAVEISLYKEGSANTVHVAKAIQNRLARLGEKLPKDVHLEVLSNQATFIQSSVSEVQSNAIFGGLLAIAVLYLFLKDRRSTAVIGVTIPLSIVATFFVMQQLGISMNIMSLGGLALGVGNLVDNAIVVLESVGRHRAMGKSVWDATLDGAGEVESAVTTSTLTTVAVFLPIVFVEGIAGQIFKDQALTVTASQIISLVAALTLIPVLSTIGARRNRGFGVEREDLLGTQTDRSAPGDRAASRRIPAPIASAARGARRVATPAILWPLRAVFVLAPGGLLRGARFALNYLGRGVDILLSPLQKVFDRSWAGFEDLYPRVLGSALRHRGRTFAAAGALALLSVLLLPTIGTELVPQFSQGEFAFTLEMPPGTPLAQTEARVRGLEETVRRDPRVRSIFSTIGENPDLGSGSGEKRENVGQIFIMIKDPGDRAQEASVIESIRGSLARESDMRSSFRRPTFFSFQTPIEVLVFGHDIDLLRDYAGQLAVELREVPGLRDVRSSLEDGSPEVQIRFQRDRMAALDLDLESVSQTLRNKIRGDVATKLRERDRQLDILVRTAQAGVLDVDQVRNLVVDQTDGIPVPLSSVADVSIGRGPAQITRVGQQRVAVIRADLAGRDLGSASKDVQAVVDRTPPPPQFVATLGGQNDEVRVSFRSLILAAALSIFLVYLVMASNFESFLHPLVIMLTVPLGMIGVVFSLAATRTPVSVVVLIGVILLGGIVVNNAIVLIEFVNQRRREGLDKVSALLDASRTRLRPIFMTTATTVLGLAPMALGLGEGAEIRAPMAIAVIGGLSFATLLTLVLIPVVYASVDRRP